MFFKKETVNSYELWPNNINYYNVTFVRVLVLEINGGQLIT